MERFYGTVEQKLKFFKSIDELVEWYNEVKPHMSLNFEELETPERVMGYASGWLLLEVRA